MCVAGYSHLELRIIRSVCGEIHSLGIEDYKKCVRLDTLTWEITVSEAKYSNVLYWEEWEIFYFCCISWSTERKYSHSQ